jgi:CheY-like chemotaxis protein
MAEQQPLILIVDDEPDFREIFKLKLSAGKMRVETAMNGKEGIEKTKQLKPDLVLMDVNMPVMDGAQALMELRKDPETKNVKVVFLTSLGDPRQEIQTLNRKFSEELGAQGYIRKTDNLDSVYEQIVAFLK